MQRWTEFLGSGFFVVSLGRYATKHRLRRQVLQAHSRMLRISQSTTSIYCQET